MLASTMLASGLPQQHRMELGWSGTRRTAPCAGACVGAWRRHACRQPVQPVGLLGRGAGRQHLQHLPTICSSASPITGGDAADPSGDGGDTQPLDGSGGDTQPLDGSGDATQPQDDSGISSGGDADLSGAIMAAGSALYAEDTGPPPAAAAAAAPPSAAPADAPPPDAAQHPTEGGELLVAGWLQFVLVYACLLGAAYVLPAVLTIGAAVLDGTVALTSKSLTDALMERTEYLTTLFGTLNVFLKIVFVLAAGTPFIAFFGLVYHKMTGTPFPHSLLKVWI
ncbi:hypothetical protein FOA52_005126 [Chlamydomonas sp. UWO 241]|nr:hypothetical protein FOA52_005126 [Chlamydomonas sp. UWO 241]